ncbi:UNVERIFIED_CONTAM: hypothetical protein Slati_4170000 [Sesamum latifolium]|uniref:Uncharacterized protein n=1 Tax=Sesamum latifolium TaxID=2727402 RepID=A0AAW2TCR9_9LAMI
MEQRSGKIIKRLKDESEWIISKDVEILLMVVDYFSHFSSDNLDIRMIGKCIKYLQPVVSNDMDAGLVRPFSLEKVNHALNHMHPLKFGRGGSRFLQNLGGRVSSPP